MKHLITLSWLLAASIGHAFGQCPDGETQISINITTDRYGDETTWILTGAGGSPTYASGGPYQQASSNGAYPQAPVYVCVPDGVVLVFTIYDEWGDGMCCAYGSGFFTVEMNGTVLASNMNFTGSSDVSYFQTTPSVPLDLAPLTLTLDDIIAPGSQTISGSIRNFGTMAVSSFDLSYSIDNGDAVTQTITANIAPNAVYNFSHGTPWAATAGDHLVTIWTSAPNSSNDDNPLNDQMSKTIAVATQSVPRKTVIEEFTSSTCVPCATLNATFDPLLSSMNTNQTGSNVLAVKYQMNWPSPGNDPSYNSDGNTRKNYYDVGGIPDVFLDGGAPTGTSWQNAIETAAQRPAFCDLAIQHTVSGATVSVDVTITPYANFSGTHKLYIVATQNHYYYPASTTSQDHFYYAMRKIMPNGGGITVNNLVAGVPQTFSQSYTFTMGGAAQNNFNTWTSALNDLTLVTFLQNQSSKAILQGAMSDITTSVRELGEATNMTLYPNPTDGILNIGLDLESPSALDITITNIVGEVIMQQRKAAVAGQQNIALDLNAFANGSYYVTIRNDDMQTTRKVTLTR